MTCSLLAQLPMYDWPEISTATDALWHAIREALAVRGIPAPHELDRSHSAEDAWHSNNLLLSQTCGLPLVKTLRKHVQVLGCFTYEGITPAGDYYSVIITRASCGQDLTNMRGKRTAINGTDSYSGCLTLQCAVAPISPTGGYFSGVQVTGSHRESIRAVVNGSADIASIDCISWQLAERYEPAVNTLKVIAQTPSRPSLPLITSCDKTDTVMEAMRAALAAAVIALDDNTRALTGITGFLPLDDTAYLLIVDDLYRCGDLSLG